MAAWQIAYWREETGLLRRVQQAAAAETVSKHLRAGVVGGLGSEVGRDVGLWSRV